MSTQFYLVLSRSTSQGQYVLTSAISGDAEGWSGTSRVFTSRAQVEDALRTAEVLAPVGPNQSIDAAASSITVAFLLPSPAPAIGLQVLRRVDPMARREKIMVTFNVLNGILMSKTAHYERQHPIVVGELLEVDTPLGRRTVEVLKITKDEVLPYGSEDTRRHVDLDIKF